MAFSLDEIFKSGVDYMSILKNMTKSEIREREPYINEDELHLTPMEYKILCLLAKNTGKVLTHKYILQNVWGSSLENDVGTLRVFMATLRKKLEQTQNGVQYIQTHIGVGYRMVKVE